MTLRFILPHPGMQLKNEDGIFKHSAASLEKKQDREGFDTCGVDIMLMLLRMLISFVTTTDSRHNRKESVNVVYY